MELVGRRSCHGPGPLENPPAAAVPEQIGMLSQNQFESGGSLSFLDTDSLRH